MLGHKTVPADIFDNKKILDIGCGRKKLAGSTGLDREPYPGVDIVADLEGLLPVESNSFDLVHANQVLEHVKDLIGLLSEINRILKPSGQLLAHVPYFRSSWAHIDPTHVRCFTLQTFDYFVEGNWIHDGYSFTDWSFAKVETFLDTDYGASPKRVILAPLAKRYPARFENSPLSFMFPFEQLTFLATKKA